MSPMMDEMLLNEVVPRLRNTVRSVPKVGYEDDEEIIQDSTLMAVRMMDSAEKAGRNQDWESFLAASPTRHRNAILVLVERGTMREAG